MRFIGGEPYSHTALCSGQLGHQDVDVYPEVASSAKHHFTFTSCFVRNRRVVVIYQNSHSFRLLMELTNPGTVSYTTWQ